MWRVALKYGIGPVLAIVLTIFLMQSVSANQAETLALVAQHQQESRTALRDQLEMLRIICVNSAPNDAQRSLCFSVGIRR